MALHLIQQGLDHAFTLDFIGFINEMLLIVGFLE
jgi:hypothetical protein